MRSDDRPELIVACTPASERAVDRAARRFTRRQALLAAGVAVAASACRDGGGQALSTLPQTGGRTGPSEPNLVVSVPPHTLDRRGLQEYARGAGVSVRKRVFESQEALVRGLHKAPSSFDVIVPRQDWLSVLAGEGWLYQLHHDLVPNRRFVAPVLLDRDFDPGNRYSLPREYAVAGFGYRADKVSEPLHSWADFFDVLPGYGRTNLLSGIVAVDLAVASLGGDLNSDDDALLARATRVLHDAVRSAGSVRNEYVAPFVRGRLFLTMGWNTGFAEIVERRPADTVFVVPEGRSGFRLESWAISAATPHPFAAHAWINHALAPSAVAQEWTRVGRSFAVPAALEKAPSEVAANPYTTVSADALERYQPFVPSPAGLQKRARIWAALAP
jgi:spermidine/putrescine transport system substrate-binding protein